MGADNFHCDSDFMKQWLYYMLDLKCVPYRYGIDLAIVISHLLKQISHQVLTVNISDFINSLNCNKLTCDSHQSSNQMSVKNKRAVVTNIGTLIL